MAALKVSFLSWGAVRHGPARRLGSSERDFAPQKGWCAGPRGLCTSGVEWFSDTDLLTAR